MSQSTEKKYTITWREILPAGKGNVPDMESEVLIYDGFLDDVVKGCLDVDPEGKPVWIEQITGDPLKDPQWWTEVPFPGEQINVIF